MEIYEVDDWACDRYESAMTMLMNNFANILTQNLLNKFKYIVQNAAMLFVRIEYSVYASKTICI